MNRLKWSIVTILATSLAGLVLSQMQPKTSVAEKQPIQAASGPPGRYQIVMSTTAGPNVFLLDTADGRTWQRTQFSDVEDQPVVWLFQTRIDSETEKRLWALRQTFKKQP